MIYGGGTYSGGRPPCGILQGEKLLSPRAGFSSSAGYRLGHQMKALQLDSYLEGNKAIS